MKTMSVIDYPTPGTHFTNGLSTANQINIANNTDPVAYNTRWQWNLTGAESTANAGSNLQLQAIADDGFTIVATPISVNRATGVVTIPSGVDTLTTFGDGNVSAPSIASTTNPASGIYFTTNAVNISANGIRSVVYNTVASGVNYISITPAATGAGPVVAAAGSDTNINLQLTPKGTGLVQFGTTGSFSTNGSVATVLGSVGPAGSSTTVQKWLTIKDSTGTTLYIPCF
jgi:hypothetical protein